MKAVITYTYKNHSPCGQTIGADGNGDYAIIIDGEENNVYDKINELHKTILASRGITDIKCIISEERYHGSPIMEISL